MSTTARQRVELTCPAKVNLALAVGRGRATDGLHPIASWMVTVHFADHLVLERVGVSDASAFDIGYERSEGSPAAARAATVDWPIESDLAFRAHGLLQRRVGRDLPVRATLKKRIPAGTGLGGGSSDAAAMLVGLDMLFDLSLDDATFIALAAQLGSDVAFLVGALRGSPSAVVTGLGETIEPSPRDASIPLILIFPPFGCPTGPVYQAFDRLQGPTAPVEPNDARVKQLAAMSPVPHDGPFNDLADAACEVEPRLRDAKENVANALALPVHITGSGSTLFVIAPTALTAAALARKVTARIGLVAVTTRTV